MGFLDNSGDIILDAVLTDTGRFRLAKGDGTFKISKYAFGDEEINYGNYNKTHDSGSAYFDLDILTTPVFEAFTNNTSVMKTKLMSIPRTNLLYLPIIKINNSALRTENQQVATNDADADGNAQLVSNGSASFFVTCDQATTTTFATRKGIIDGVGTQGGSYIRVDQGLDTTEIPKTFAIDPDLKETQYIIQLDNRLGKIVSVGGNVKNPSFIDDDNIAHYYISMGVDSNFIGSDFETNSDITTLESNNVINGPRGTHLSFSVNSSVELQTSTHLFTKLGNTFTLTDADAGGTATALVKFIDTLLRITGATTGYSIDIPIRFIKQP